MVMEKSVQSLVYSTPTPSSISYLWNFGSLLGISLAIQLISGVFLAIHYKASLDFSFDSVIQETEEVFGGWILRSSHANGASLFFLMVYLHLGRAIYVGSYVNAKVWFVGILILLVLMATAFLGYVLPWGQMSLWGATVITNLFSAIPYVGVSLVEWIWGGFSVSEPTLVRFFSVHFLLPFVIVFLAMTHVLVLHEKGSSNLLGVEPHSDKVYFHPFFVIKDVVGMVVVFLCFFLVVILKGDVFMDPDNFIGANPLSTPPHIQPEWYFLFAYAILRSIPNKLGGVIALFMSIGVLLILPVSKPSKGLSHKFLSVCFFLAFVLLTWIGGMPVEKPLSQVGQVVSFAYFFMLTCLAGEMSEKVQS